MRNAEIGEYANEEDPVMSQRSEARSVSLLQATGVQFAGQPCWRGTVSVQVRETDR